MGKYLHFSVIGFVFTICISMLVAGVICYFIGNWVGYDKGRQQAINEFAHSRNAEKKTYQQSLDAVTAGAGDQHLQKSKERH